MSKIKHWNGQSWEIDGASNAANIELTNPGFLNENGDSISVDQGFTKLDNRMNKLERNLAWIYQNGAKGGGSGGGGGGVDSTEYTISVEEGNRVYTAGTSVTIHLTINGGSLRKIFQVEITNAQTGERLASPVVTGLTRTEITINGLSESTQTLKISAHTGLYYASDFILTVVAGAIKLSRTRVTPTQIYPTSVVNAPVFQVTNSTDSNLKVVVVYTTDQLNYHTLTEFDIEKTSSISQDFTIPAISNFLEEQAQINIGETYTFSVYAQGVLNDNVLKSNVITFSTTIIQPNTLYILTYGVNKSTPGQVSDLAALNQFVYGQSVQFEYELSYSNNNYPIYNIEYTVAPCYFEDGILVTRMDQAIQGEVNRVNKGVSSIFSFSTASLPTDTIYDTENNEYKFIKVVLTAVSNEDPTITDTKVLYFTLSRALEKYITATNFDRSLICYYSPVMGVPTGNINVWRYDNQNTQFPYNRQGIVQQRFIDLIGYNVNGLRNGFSTQGIHLTGKSYALLGLNLFSSQSNEINLLNGNGFTISTTFRTDANIDNSSVVMSLGKYVNDAMVAGIEITAGQVKVVVNRQETSLSITKGDLTTIDIALERYVGEGDTEENPTHWFVKIFLNGVLSSLGSYESSQFTTTSLGTGWYFDDYLCLGARLDGDDVISAADVHFYDLKVYSTSLSDNEITQNQVSATIYAELENGANPSQTLQNELLSKNFIQMNTEGEYESLLFDTNDVRQYKDDNTLLSTLRAALADSKIPYPIVVINQLTANSNFYGTTQAQFSEDQKAIVTGQEYRYPINMDYYTMGNAVATRISNQERMLISIQGTSSLQFVSKNYEIYMGADDTNKPVLVQMREDWLPENEYTLKADVMDSSHVNNVLIGRIINGMVTTTDASGQEVAVKPLDNTPPMNTINQWANKIKHTSEGYPVILFINFKNSDGSTITKCQGIYNFNLGRAASFNLGLKLLTSCTFVDDSATFPRMVDTYEESLTVVNNSPVYSIEVGENNQQIGAFDQDDPNILSSGIFDTIYASDGAASTHLQRLLTFLSNFGWNIQNPKKILVDGQWCTPKIVKNGAAWEEQGYYLPANPADYVQSTLELHMNWNNLIAYYIIAIIFGLVDSMGKNLTLRTWNMINDENGILQCIWYMCFYDMDTAMRLDNDGNETVPYNAHLNRYYTDNSGVFSEAKVDYHTASIIGQFTQVYSSYNTRLQEIAENLKDISKSLSDVYVQLRNNLFPDPGAFIDKYYTGQINQIGAALYNYDYKLKYLQTKKQYSVQTGELVGTNDYNQISYLHGNGATNIKSWFKKRIRFLDGIYGADTDGKSILNNNNLVDVTLNEIWSNNQAIKNLDDPTVIQLTLASESQTFINISMGSATKNTLWINENPTVYKLRNVSAQQRISVYGNKVITTLGGFNKFRWIDLNAIDFPLIKSLSLKGATNINADAFVTGSQTVTGLQSLRELDLSGVLLTKDSNVVYKGLDFVKNLPSLEWLDISDSSFNDVSLPESGVLKYLNVSNTRIKEINFVGQPLLEELILDGCTELEVISLTNCPKLKQLSIPASVKRIVLANCPGLEALVCTYNGRQISPLEYITVSACEGLKTFNIEGQNNPELEVFLQGAPNLENVNLRNTAASDIVFSSSWTSLKTLDISNTAINALNYGGTISTVLDLKRHTGLSSINANNNYSITEVQCPNIESHKIVLGSSAFKGCSALTRIIGNFQLNGTQIFQGCSSLKLNSDYTGVAFTSDYISGDFCNISFNPDLSSYSEMFSGSGISGQDFRYIMYKVQPNVTTLNKMFQGCAYINVAIWSDLFSKCPNVTDITSFAEGTGLMGTFYSTTENRRGILDYLPNLRIANYAFFGTSLEWIDNNAFKDNTSITEADYMFGNCTLLNSCSDTDNPQFGYLHSKNFFLNLSNLTNVAPKGMFQGCAYIKMLIDSEEVNGVMFDYLFHCPIDKAITATTLNNSLYTGVKLIGEVHANVFGGILNTDGQYYIPEYPIITGPFSLSDNDELVADLNSFKDMFKNLNPTSLINVLKGIHFRQDISNEIPNDIFEGCTNLLNVSGFFSNSTITNNGTIYEFPSAQLFRDCPRLTNVSNLFDGDKYLNIRLIGEGFLNNPIVDCSEMLKNSGVFGTIPYKFLRTTGKTITNMENIFSGCYKLGYTSDRTISEGELYYKGETAYRTEWQDAVILNPGTPLYFSLDYSDSSKADPLYIDGNPWPEDWKALASFDQEVYDYDVAQQNVLLGPINRTENCYQNYMFPADLFYSCNCSLKNALNGLSYKTNILSHDSNGLTFMEEGPIDGLKGRLPMKLLQTDVTEIENLFEGLDFSPFVGFSSQIYDVQMGTAQQARGIKLPPDLFRYATNITSLSETFKGITVEAGIDLNLNLSSLTNLRSVKGMLSDVQFYDNPVSGDIMRNDDEYTYSQGSLVLYPQVSADTFLGNHELRDISSLFQVTNIKYATRGLIHISSTMFQPEDPLVHPYLSDVSSVFFNNVLLTGTIPLMLGNYITSWSGYIEGVQKANIRNANDFISAHSDESWLPVNWRDNQ